MTDPRDVELGRALDAGRVFSPAAGELVRVREGKAFVFAQGADGRRVEVTTLVAGDVMVGCSPHPGGSRLLLAGIPDTRIDIVPLDDSVGEACLRRWVSQLGRFLADGNWPQRVADVREVEGVLALGEASSISPSPDSIESDPLEWVSLVSGSANVCGLRDATIGPLDPPFPLSRSMWLTAGSRCRPRVAASPSLPSQWIGSLDLIGLTALAAAHERRVAEDREALSRLNPRRRSSREAARASVELLAGAVTADGRATRHGIGELGLEHVAAVMVARASCSSNAVDTDELIRLASDPSLHPAEAAAAAVGAMTREVTLDRTWPWRDGRPLLAWRPLDDHGPRRPVAILRERHWVVIDPVVGSRRRLDARALAALEPRGVEFVPLLPRGPAALRDLVRAARPGVRRDIMWGTLLTLLIGASAFAGPLLLGRLLARGATHGDGANPAVPVAIVLLSIAASTCFAAARAFCILRIRASSASTAASALLDRTLRQTPTWHRQRPFGERFGQAAAVMNASTAMPDDAVARLLDLVVVGGSMAAVATTSWSLFAATVAVLVVEAAVVTAFLRATRARAAARAEAGLVVAGRLQELLKGVTRLRVTGAQSRALLHWARAQVVLSRADQQLRRMRAAHYVVLGVWPAVVLVAVVAVAGVSNASLESLLTTQLALAAAGGSIAAAVFAADSGMIADSALRRALPVLASPPEGGHHLRSPGTLQGAIGARDLVFRYHENGPAVLDHVSIRVSPGEHVAVVGPSGCGKTTLMRVLLGLEHAESGTLTFDGVDLALLDQPAVRRQIGSVLQSAELLPSSIRRNVDMGRGLGAADIWAALDTAGLGAEVRQMPLGLDTPVSDGSGTLSGGQRQRVLIARALASNPRVLVLDEATSALDNVSQAAVVDVLGRLRITRVTVAHRLSTIRHADRIFVMEAGRVVDEGTFDELMARNELFRAMAMRQQA